MKLTQSILAASILASIAGMAHADIYVGNDLNSNSGTNDTINQLYSGNRGSNGGGDQSLQFGDVIQGSDGEDLLVGGLGIDVLFGGNGDDVIVGGTEDFNGLNRDRAFGEQGNDVFIWAPGDGNDFFDGGDGTDVLIMALIGESRDDDGNTEGAPFFSVNPPNRPSSQNFDGIHVDPATYLPVVDVVGSPGFCEILDQQASGMAELGLDNLVRFILRSPANAFDEAVAADPNIDIDTLDTGLRVAVHLTNTEFVVCGSRDASEAEVFDLRQAPIQKVSINELPANAYKLMTVGHR